MAFVPTCDMLHCNMAGARSGGTFRGAWPMAWSQGFPGAALVGARTETALRMPIGVVSPLWAMFGAAASAGVAYWWMTRWTQAVNIEAFAGALAPAAKAVALPAEVVAELALAPAVEAPVAEAVVEVEAIEAKPVAAEAV